MVFASKSKYDFANFKIELQEGISPIYHLLIELFQGKGDPNDFRVWAGQLFDLEKIANSTELRKEETEDSFLEILCKYLREDMNSSLDFFTTLSVRYINVDSGIGIFKEGVNVSTLLSNWIKKYSPIDELFSLIKDETVKSYQEKLCKYVPDAKWVTSVKVENNIKYEATLIPLNWLEQDTLKMVETDRSLIYAEENIWKSTGVNNETTSLYELYFNEEVIGIKFGEYLLPYRNLDNHIKKDCYPSYFWSMLQDVYCPPSKPIILKETDKEFLESGKLVDFSKVLSHLKYNLYITDANVIPEANKSLFEEVYNFSKLKHLDNYELYTSIPENGTGQTLVGVYELEKPSGQTNYNLLCWHNADNKKVILTNDNKGSSTKEVPKVFALKPQYGYYYISRYFEDLMSGLLAELKVSSINNVKLYEPIKGKDFIAEIDHLVFKSDGTFMFIEDKTTLSRFNVESTLKNIVRFKKAIDKLGFDLKLEYVIVAPYSNSTLEESYLYFIKNGERENNRKGFATKVYDFRVPIAEFENLELRCIVEPEYDKLKEKIRTIVA